MSIHHSNIHTMIENVTTVNTDVVGEEWALDVTELTSIAPKEDVEDSGAEPYIAVVILVLISFGNGLVIISVYINPMLREWTYYFIVNLALSDLTTVGCCLCGVIITSARHLLSTGVLCVMAYGSFIFVTSSSARFGNSRK